MIPLIIILCVAAIIAFLLSMKVTLRIKYCDALKIYLKIFFVKIRLYPFIKIKKRYRHSMSKRKAEKIKKSLQKKPKKESKKSEKSKKTPKKEKSKEKTNEFKLEPSDILAILAIITEFIKSFTTRFSRSVRIKASRLNIVIACDDAASTAIAYGAVTQGINVLFPLLDGIKNFKKLPKGKNLSVVADFVAESSSIDVDIEIYVRVIKVIFSFIVSVFKAFTRAVKDRMKVLERKQFRKK